MVRPIMLRRVCAGIFTLPAAGKVGSPGKLARAMPTILVLERPRANVDPMVLQQLDGDIAVGQQFDVVVQLAGGNGAGAFALHLGGARGAQAEIEIGGGDGQPVVRSLE